MDILFFILFATLITAFMVSEIMLIRRWNGGWRIAALLPGAAFLAVVINIAIGTSLDRTSHNLWPMELVLWSTGGLAYLGVLVLIHKIKHR